MKYAICVTHTGCTRRPQIISGSALLRAPKAKNSARLLEFHARRWNYDLGPVTGNPEGNMPQTPPGPQTVILDLVVSSKLTADLRGLLNP